MNVDIPATGGNAARHIRNKRRCADSAGGIRHQGCQWVKDFALVATTSSMDVLRMNTIGSKPCQRDFHRQRLTAVIPVQRCHAVGNVHQGRIRMDRGA